MPPWYRTTTSYSLASRSTMRPFSLVPPVDAYNRAVRHVASSLLFLGQHYNNTFYIVGRISILLLDISFFCIAASALPFEGFRIPKRKIPCGSWLGFLGGMENI